MKKLLILTALVVIAMSLFSQVNISPGGTITENFTIGVSQTATLPTGWKADKNSTARTLGTYSAAATATEQRAGNNMSSSATNGIYNYAAGDPTTATERAIGWISSSSATKSGNLYVQLYNNGTSQIPSFTISYGVEKYRMGTNAAGFSIQMYYSTNGTSWTSAGADFLTSFPADASTSGYASAPGATSNVTNKTLSVAVDPSSSIYLAWNYSVTSGTTTSNAQGLGVDDISINAAQSQGGTPTITVTGVPLNDFGGILVGNNSTSQSYTVSGTDLDDDIDVTAPTGFSVSTDGTNWFSSVTLFQSSGEVEETTVYARFSPTAVQSYTGNIAHTSPDAATVNVAVAGTGIKGEPSNHPTAFQAEDGTNPQTDVLVSWTDATGTVIPDGYLIKASSTGFSAITDPTDGVAENNTILVQNVLAGIQSYNFTNLTSATTYYFKIYSYTNAGSSINYKLDGTIQTASHTTEVGPAITEVIVPQYMQGLNGTNNQRIPWACRLTLENLIPSATYRYFGMFVDSADGPTVNGAGIDWFVNLSSNFTRATNLSLNTSGQYGEFTTDASGSYTGWFMGEPSGNARFTPGNTVWYRLMLNDGNSGTAVATRLTTASSIKVINFGTQENVNQGTFLYGVSAAPAMNFAFVYDNEAGTGRPIAGTVIESDGLDLSGVNQILPAYKSSVDAIDGAWGVIIPNSTGTKGFTGIKRVEARVLETGAIYAQNTDPDGIWNGISTVNPTGGDATPIDLTDEATLPVELSSFTATIDAHNYVNLTWVTQSETNVMGFYVYRSSMNDLSTAELISTMIPATNTSQQQFYTYTDSDLYSDGLYYYWLQNSDFDGSSNFHGPVHVSYSADGQNNGSPEIPSFTELKAIYPNPFNPIAYIPFSVASRKNVDIKIYNTRGQVVRSFTLGTKEAGSYRLEWNGMDDNGKACSTGVYYVRMTAGNDSFVRKAVLMK